MRQAHTKTIAGKDKCRHSIQHCAKPKHIDLMLKKGVYPYDRMVSFSKFDETQLPPIEAYYNKLSNEPCRQEDYECINGKSSRFRISE